MRELSGLISDYLNETGKYIEDIFKEIDEDDNGDMDVDEFSYYFLSLKK